MKLRIDELISEEIRYLDPELNLDPEFLRIRNRGRTRRGQPDSANPLSDQFISAEIAYLDPEFNRDPELQTSLADEGRSTEARVSFWPVLFVIVTLVSLAWTFFCIFWSPNRLR